MKPKDVPVKVAELRILNKGDKCIGPGRPENEVSRRDVEPGSGGMLRAGPLLASIDKLVLVHRLREVVALLGFTRFEAVSPDKDGELDLNVSRAALADHNHLASRNRAPRGKASSSPSTRAQSTSGSRETRQQSADTRSRALGGSGPKSEW